VRRLAGATSARDEVRTNLLARSGSQNTAYADAVAAAVFHAQPAPIHPECARGPADVRAVLVWSGTSASHCWRWK
jgi:hypothetical protein